MLISTRREKTNKTQPSYLKSVVIMSEKSPSLDMIFTLEQNKTMQILQQQLVRKKLCMYLKILLLEALEQKPDNEEKRGNALFFTLV